MEEILASVKAKHQGQPRDKNTLPTSEREGEINAISGTSKSSGAGCAKKAEVKVIEDEPMHEKHSRSGQADFNKVTGKVDLCLTMHFHIQHCSE